MSLFSITRLLAWRKLRGLRRQHPGWEIHLSRIGGVYWASPQDAPGYSLRAHTPAQMTEAIKGSGLLVATA